MKQNIIMSAGFIALILALWAGVAWYRNNYSSARNFEECVKTGNVIQETYPRICKAGAKHFVEQTN